MKRFLTLLLTTLALTAVLCVSASASDFDAVAEDLSAIGMFRGTGASFELDRAPTRAEAAIMLVRLYGAEEEATADYAAGKIQHPFKDVPSFAAPHVAWLYEKELTKGMSADTFGSTGACSAQNYATFLLRALGYKDGVDFEYSGALAYAGEKGFYNEMMFSGDFLRDDLAALTCQALAADTKEGGTYLLKSLVDSGAVSAEAAKPMTEKMELYRTISSISATQGGALDMALKAKMDITMAYGGITETTATNMEGSIAMKKTDDDIQMAYEMAIKANGLDMDMGIWMKDGWMYLSMSNGTNTQKVKSYLGDMEAMLEELGGLEISEMTGVDVSGLAAIKSLTAEKSGSDTVYTMVVSGSLGGMMDTVMSLVGQETEGMNIGEISVAQTVSRSGELKEIRLLFSMSMKMALPDETGTMIPITADYDYDITMGINAMGKDVKISFPSFSGFVEIDPSQMEAIA